MSKTDANDGGYRKSSYSSANGDCVEVWDRPGRVQVRDSKNPDGLRLTIPNREWSAFLSAIKADEFGL